MFTHVAAVLAGRNEDKRRTVPRPAFRLDNSRQNQHRTSGEENDKIDAVLSVGTIVRLAIHMTPERFVVVVLGFLHRPRRREKNKKKFLTSNCTAFVMPYQAKGVGFFSCNSKKS